MMATHGLDFQVCFWSTDEWTFAGSITPSDRRDLRIAFGADPARLFAVSERSVWETLAVGTRSGEAVLLA